MPYLFLTLGLFAFLFAFHHFQIAGKVKEALLRTRGALAVARAAELSDAEKERALQRAALRVSGAFLRILLCSGLAALAALACLFAGTAVGLFELREAMAAAQNPLFILFLSLIAAVTMKLAR